MSKCIGHRIGEFEGEKRESGYRPPEDAGTILKPRRERNYNNNEVYNKLFGNDRPTDKDYNNEQTFNKLFKTSKKGIDLNKSLKKEWRKYKKEIQRSLSEKEWDCKKQDIFNSWLKDNDIKEPIKSTETKYT